MSLSVERLYYELLLRADRGLTSANPAVLFVLILACIVGGLEVSYSGFRKKELWWSRLGLVLTGCAAAWSVLAFITVQNGGGGVSPREAAFLTYFFGFTSGLALLCLAAEAILYLLLHRLLLEPLLRGELPDA